MTRKQAKLTARIVVVLAALLFLALVGSVVLAEEPAAEETGNATAASFAMEGAVTEVIHVPGGPDEITVRGKTILCPGNLRGPSCSLDMVGAIVHLQGEAIDTPHGWIRVLRVVEVVG